jgi:SAM-dependent methyltransferase
MTRPNISVVDLGFGTTGPVAELAGLCRTYTIVDVVDRTDGAGLPTNVLFKQADLDDNFPFEDDSFDCTVAMMIVEHLFDPFHSFKEITRITKPGGHIFINVPNVAALKCRAQLAFGKIPVTSAHNWFERREWDGNHLHYFTVKEVLRLARLQGLKLDAIFPVGRYPRFKQLLPTLLCHEISYGFSRP